MSFLEAIDKLQANGELKDPLEDTPSMDLRPSMLNKTMDEVRTLNPDEQAQNLDLAERHRMPASMVEHIKPDLEKVDYLNRINSRELLKTHPKTGAYLLNKENASISSDDVDNLKQFEQIEQSNRIRTQADLEKEILDKYKDLHSDSLSDNAERGVMLNGLIAETASWGIDKLLTEIGRNFLPEPKGGGSVDDINLTSSTESTLMQTVKAYNAMPNDKRIEVVMQLFQQGWDNDHGMMGFIDSMNYAAKNPDLLANFMSEQMIASMPTAVVGGSGGSLVANQFTKYITNRYLAKKITEKTIVAAASGLSTAAVTYNMEFAQQINKGMTPEQAHSYAATKAGAEGGTNAVLAGLLPWFGNSYTKSGAVTKAASGAFNQGVAGAGGAYAGAQAVGEDIQEGELMLEFMAEMLGSPIELVTAAAMSPEVDKIKQAEDAQRLFEGLSAAATDVMTRARIPKVFKKFAADVTQDGPVENLYIDAAKFKEFYQNNPEARVLFQDVAGIEAQLEAAEREGDIVIPTADYAAYIAGTEFDQALRGDIRFAADAWSFNEAQAFKDPDQFRQTVEDLAKQMEEGRVRDEATAIIQDEIRQQLLNAGGYTYQAADSNAMLWAAFYRTMASNTGVDPNTLYQRHWFGGVQSVAPADIVGRPVEQIDLDLQALREGKPVTQQEMYGDSIVEFIARAGGVRDEGGELSAMDAQQWHKQQRGRPMLIKPDGDSIDGMGERLLEAGYFQERPSERQILEAIRQELSGKPFFSNSNRNEKNIERAARLDALFDYLSQQGFDPVTADPDEIKKFLFSDDGQVGMEQAEKTPYKPEQDFSNISIKEAGFKPNGDAATVTRKAQTVWDKLQARRQALTNLLDCVNA